MKEQSEGSEISCRDTYQDNSDKPKRCLIVKTNLAISKRFLTSFSDSPSHLLTRSLLETEKKVELLAYKQGRRDEVCHRWLYGIKCLIVAFLEGPNFE